MKIFEDVNIKSIIYGAVIAILCILLGYRSYELFYPFSALGLLYAGYSAANIKQGTIAGAITAIPIALMALFGYFGSFTGFFNTVTGITITVIIILLVGAFVGFVGAWAKRDRVKALEEYNKKNSKGKNKKKK